MKQVARGIVKGREVITLEFLAHVAMEEPYDEVIIEGVPRIHERIFRGYMGI